MNTMAKRERARFLMKKLALGFFFYAFAPSSAKATAANCALSVTDPSGLGVKTTIQIISTANQYHHTLVTSDQGSLDVAATLPYGIYRLEIDHPGFAPLSQSVEIRSGASPPITKSSSNCLW